MEKVTTTTGSPALKNLKLALLAGTCLSGATANTQAVLVIESADFANDLTSAVSAPQPVGTDAINGNVTFTSDDDDFVAFQSLTPGGSFTLEFGVTGGNVFDWSVLDSTGASLGSPTSPVVSSGNTTFTGIIPLDGVLVAQVDYNEGSPYTIALTAPVVPEPSTAMLVGAGALATVVTRRRSRRISLAE